MDSQMHRSPVAIDARPQEDRLPFVVDGVSFALDVSAIGPQGQRAYTLLSEHGALYEPVMTRCLAKLITQMEKPTFMDIGAYAGYYTCYVATLLGDHSRPITAIESNPRYCEGIRRSCELNQLRNVTLYEAVLSDRFEAAHVEHASVILGGTPDEHMTTAIPLDALCERESIAAPNIVKIDTHGSEGKALFGMTSILRNVDYLLLELHGQDRLDDFSAGMRRSAILEHLWTLGLSVYYMAGHTLNAKQWNRECIRSGRFAYRKVTADNADCLLFDRLWHMFLLVTPREDLQPILGESLTDPLLCY